MLLHPSFPENLKRDKQYKTAAAAESTDTQNIQVQTIS